MRERLEAVARGRVQLVMYRDFVARKARGLGLSGEVKNLDNGTVCVIAEGPRAQLEELCAWLSRGSLLARVEEVACVWLPATGEYASFAITYE